MRKWKAAFNNKGLKVLLGKNKSDGEWLKITDTKQQRPSVWQVCQKGDRKVVQCIDSGK